MLAQSLEEGPSVQVHELLDQCIVATAEEDRRRVGQCLNTVAVQYIQGRAQRVIAHLVRHLPGDTLQVIKRVLYVNGQPAPLPKNMHFSFPRMGNPGSVDDRLFPPGVQWNEENYGPVVIPKKGMTVQIDPRTIQAWDTFIRREGHTVAVNGDRIEIDGKQATEYTVQRDYLFGMGDHRDNSLDSRYWGFIPKDNLVGTPVLVYWSWNTDIPIYSIFSKLASVRLGRIGTIIK